MRYFTDRAGHVARVLTDAPFGPEFSRAEGQTFNAKRDTWIDVPDLSSRVRFSGDWDECSEAEAEALMAKARAARRVAV